MLRLLLFLGLLLWTAPVHATTFFDTDFEAGATACDWVANGWTDFGTQAPCGGKMSISTDTAISGTHSLKLTYETINNTFCVTPCRAIYKGSSAVPPFPAGDHRFFRWAVKVTSGFQISVYNTKQIIFHNGSYPRAVASLNSGTYQMRIEGPFDGGNVDISDTGFQPRRDQWDQFEMEFQLNTCGQSNGLLRLWVNGNLKVEKLNRAWRGAGANSTGLVSSCSTQIDLMEFYLQNGMNDIYYDRVAAGDTRIGLISGSTPPPPAGDTTPPSPPTSVTVN